MANTYTQIYIHVVYAVRGRRSLIPMGKRDELFKYITGIVRNRGQKMIAINSMSDHIHIFIGVKPTIALSDLVRDIKAGSSGFINEKNWLRGKFNWQDGFGAFSHWHFEIDRVVNYIRSQEEHHRKKNFREEYVDLLRQFNINYDDRYIFTPVETEEGQAATDVAKIDL